MSTVERRARIAASPHEVWTALADFADISRWAPNVDHSCLQTEQSDGIGMVRRIQSGRTTVIETVERWEPDVAIGYAITGLPPVVRSVTNTWTLAPGTEGTDVTLTTEIDTGPRPPQRLVAKVVGRKLADASDQMLAGLTAHLAAHDASHLDAPGAPT